MKKMLPLAIGVALMAAASSAFAITDEEGNASLQFNFSAPGARSLAMGGAFIGLADDATAAFSNPAGLVQLASPEVGFEYRLNDFTTEYVNTGTYTTDPFNTDGLSYEEARSDTRGPSFVSLVYPMDKWAFAFYRHEFLNYETAFLSRGASGDDGGRIFPFAAAIDVSIVSYGLSSAYKFSDDLSFGISLNAYDLELDSATARFTNVGDTAVRFFTQQQGDDGAFGFSLGAQYKINDQLQAGLVYRHAPEFKYTASIFQGNTPGISFPRVDKSAYFDTPDLFGVGLVYRPTEEWTIAVDVAHVMYSQLTDDMQSNFILDDSGAAARAALDPLKIDDGVELRLGMEYTFTEAKVPFSLRAGVWRDPEHTVRFEGTPATTAGDALANAVLFSAGDDEVHTSVGFGWAFEKFQLDAAFDASERNETVSLSGVVRF
jgi:long-subunit fatty acid transport protein